jgi:hypothetical protein
MKFSDTALLRVTVDGRPIMTKLAPVTASTYFAALKASASAARRGEDPVLEMTDHQGNVDVSRPWLDITRDLERVFDEALAS